VPWLVSLETLDLEILHVAVLLLAADESFRELDRFESCDPRLVYVHEFRRLFIILIGIAVQLACRIESDLDELKLSEETEWFLTVFGFGFCCISWIW
jgi:hypothetical protein